MAGAVADLGQHGTRDVEHGQQLVVPLPGVNVVQQGAGRVGCVGRMHAAFGQAPQQEAVDGAEGEVASLGPPADAGNVVQYPANLGGREVRIEPQAGAGGDHVTVSRCFQGLTSGGGPAVLPDYCIADGATRGPVPDDGGFALVGDADAGDVRRVQPGTGQRLPRGFDRRGPNYLRIVLDPAGLRKKLFELPPGGCHDLERGAEHHGPRGRRSLVDDKHMSLQ